MLARYCSARALIVSRLALAGRQERGQTTAEYALVLLGAAAVAIGLISWATRSGKISGLLDAVLDLVLKRGT